MSRMSSRLSWKNVVVLAATFLTVTSPGFAAAVSPLDPNGILRGYAGAEAELFRLDVSSPGVVTLDVMTPRVDENPVKLEVLESGVLDSGCVEMGTTVVERSAAHLVLDVDAPRTFYLRVATRWPGRYKLVTSSTSLRQALSLKTDPEEVDPDPDPGTLTAPENGTCAPAGRSDDHGDVPACTTSLRLGTPVAGTLANAWGDDIDVFALVLDEVTTLEVTVLGNAAATLHDGAGQRLAADGDGTWTVGPGRYFVYVEGFGVEGAYELRVTARPW